MSALVAISITTAILSGIWGWVAVSFGLLAWAGFLGCTSFFAAPQEGVKGLLISLITNLSGVFWAMVILTLSDYISLEIIGYVLTGVVTLFMCLQAKQTWLAYIPGTFIGSCATFASNGDWQLVIPSLMLGGLFGFCMKWSGLWLKERCEPKASEPTAPELSRLEESQLDTGKTR
ncbi:DUF1097 domain-containing protein [Vibrio renipiscarius]|uniref:Membrane protein n=1 Tax=Vibrio renipiscarius TaxID=1461322 RepID=A0A0C2NXI9_9VIBR|nr:DUF1097 domain-containing protein [Vibrio renipiscarius]KII75469.1 membrane protein [Vibrio renipiscarius]KII78922.1 membrane protein [Vibrio renipiscarius]